MTQPSTLSLIAYTLVMAAVTYLIRMLPFVVFRKPIKNRLIRSFLYYVPYAVLGAMTFPAILYSTESFPSAVCGLAAAVIMAYRGCGLLPVAAVSCLTVYLSELLLGLF